jgi:hypothetical protein
LEVASAWEFPTVQQGKKNGDLKDSSWFFLTPLPAATEWTKECPPGLRHCKARDLQLSFLFHHQNRLPYTRVNENLVKLVEF